MEIDKDWIDNRTQEIAEMSSMSVARLLATMDYTLQSCAGERARSGGWQQKTAQQVLDDISELLAQCNMPPIPDERPPWQVVTGHALDHEAELIGLKRKEREPDHDLRARIGAEMLYRHTGDAVLHARDRGWPWRDTVPAGFRAVPLQRDIQDVPSAAQRRALDQAMDVTAREVLPSMGFQLMASQKMSTEGTVLRPAVWLRKDSGYLFMGMRELLELIRDPERRCLQCLEMYSTHDNTECEFILSPGYEPDRDQIMGMQGIAWSHVREFQLELAGYTPTPAETPGYGWTSPTGRYFISKEEAYLHLSTQAMQRYMSECVHCDLGPQEHGPQMLCLGLHLRANHGHTTYLSRLQSMMTEDQPQLHELLTERDKPLTAAESRS
jgi:hypothetical protein